MANCLKPVGLIVPHVGHGGGAGIYIRDLIEEISCYANLRVAGDHRLEYASFNLGMSDCLDGIQLYLPNYRGVSFLAKLYWTAVSIIQIFLLILSRKSVISELKFMDFVIVTSSVQAFIPVLLKLFGYRGRTICIVQENLELSGVPGYFIRRALSRTSAVVAISPSWQKYASSFSLETVLLENKFSRPNSESVKITFDIVYVGGGDSLKGFPEMLRACKEIAKHRPLKVAMLGRYTEKASREIRDVEDGFRRSGSVILNVGLVSDVYSYLKSAKVLVLPIREGHFLRPAIEAGLCLRTFVVAKHPGIEDFAIDNLNCLMYEPGDTNEMVRCIEKVIDDDEERTRLAEANHELSSRFIDSENWGLRLRRIVGVYEGAAEPTLVARLRP